MRCKCLQLAQRFFAAHKLRAPLRMTISDLTMDFSTTVRSRPSDDAEGDPNMTAELLDWVCAYLERDDEIIVPVKKMWNEWHAAHGEPSLEAFTAIVLADERIEDMGNVTESNWMDSSAAEAAENMRQSEAIGLFSGPQAKLKSREITQEHIGRMLQKHSDRIALALDQVLESLPTDFGETEGEDTSEAVSLVKKLREHLADEEDDSADAEDK